MQDLTNYQPESIIVRMPNWIGDMVMATPILTLLRKQYPQARITVMTRTPGSELLEGDPEIDELFCFKRTGLFVRHSERRDIIGKIRNGKYDLGILLTHSFSSAWWFWQGKVKYRLGYEGNGRDLFLTHKLPLPSNVDKQHLVYTYQNLLSALGIKPKEKVLPRLFLREKEIADAKQLLYTFGIRENHKIIGMNPGAAYGSAKCWLPERFREVTEKLLKEDVYILYFGDQVSSPLVKEICAGLPSRVINLAGLTSLRELACIISLCDVLVTNDSGPMHMAAALGTPLVALFGSTNEIVTGPYNSGTVIHKHADCSPCYQRTCPIDFRCMKSIQSDEVYDEVIKILRPKEKLRII